MCVGDYFRVRSLFPLVDGDTAIGAYEPTADTADTVVVVFQSCVVVAFLVHIRRMELNDVCWTGHNTQVTTLTVLCVYDDRSSCLSHSSNGVVNRSCRVSPSGSVILVWREVVCSSLHVPN